MMVRVLSPRGGVVSLARSCSRSLSAAAPVVDVKLKPSAGPLGKFQWNDALNLQSCYTADERMIQQAAREYCQAELMPRIVMANRKEKFDRNIFKVSERTAALRRTEEHPRGHDLTIWHSCDGGT